MLPHNDAQAEIRVASKTLTTSTNNAMDSDVAAATTYSATNLDLSTTINNNNNNNSHNSNILVSTETTPQHATSTNTKVPGSSLESAVILNVKCNCQNGNLYNLQPLTDFSLLPTRTNLSSIILETEEKYERKYLADQRHYWPPPVFIVFISALEVSVFLYNLLTVEPYNELMNTTTIPSESLLIYRPDRRLEIWRFVTYMVLHANWFHLMFNVIIQMLYGLPLEMVHGTARIGSIYVAGVLAGSLGTSVIDSEVYLVGASGGVYALLASQLANVMINFGQMRYGVQQLLAVLLFVFCDTVYAFYTRFILDDNHIQLCSLIPSVSYIAHLTGSLAGFTIGLVVLKNFEDSQCDGRIIRWIALAVYATFTIFAIIFNLVNSIRAQELEEQGEVMKEHLFHDLGIS